MKIKISKALRKEINRQAGFKGKANKQQVLDWLESAHAVVTGFRHLRLKPRTITQEITYPEPLRDAPEPGVKVYRAAPDISKRYHLVYWHNVDYQAQWLRDGLLHSTQDAAIAHGKALAGDQ